MEKLIHSASLARLAAGTLAGTTAEMRNNALLAIADALLKHGDEIFEANKKDIQSATEQNQAQPLIKRLKFDEKKLADVVDGIRSLVKLPDPIGKTSLARELDDDLKLYRVSCPLGVIGVIFEARPDALVQIASLCLKSGNAVLLKGGSEAVNTNRALADVIYKASRQCSMPEGWIELLETRQDVINMLKLDEYIDLLIPRGSNSFVKYIMENTSIPVLGHADGVCHTYVDKAADMDMAIKVVVDCKTQYVSVCNATETLLVHSSIANQYLPALKEALDKKDVELFGCPRAAELLGIPTVDEWHTEYLDYKMSVRIVDDVDEAMQHIYKYSSKHTEAIITSDEAVAQHFMRYVDSGNVFWNCSTRFSDGFRYGFGAEVGISTSKIHARGPVGLEGLMSYKYLAYGNGNIVDDYATQRKKFTHVDIDEKCPLYK